MQRLVPSQTLVAVIDIQEGLAAAMAPARMADLTRGVPLLLATAKLLGAPVLATEQYPKGLKRTIAPVLERLDELGVPPFEKTAFSAVEVPEFQRRLEQLAPRTVVVVGMETHVCVYQTVRDLRAKGFEVLVPVDGVASRRDEDRAVGLALCEKAGAIATSIETIVFDWVGRAGTDDFRAISKWVR
ncbi:MAG TPA: isochorismatase family protein [Polyangiaceae bacterium]|nr:isochorismatase family protein [Polyangiaceae bacterium]